MARGGLNTRLIEAIEVLAGFRGNKRDAAVRRKDLLPYEYMIDKNKQFVVGEVDDIKEEINDAEGRIIDAELELEQLGIDLDAAEIEIEQAKQDILAASSTANDVLNKHDALTAGFDDTLADAFEQRDQTLADARGDIDSVRTDVDSVRGDYDSLTAGFTGTIAGAFSAQEQTVNAAFAERDAALTEAMGEQDAARAAALAQRDAAIEAADNKIDAEAGRLDHRIDLQTPTILEAEKKLDEVSQAIAMLATVTHDTNKNVYDAGLYVDEATGEVKIYALEQIRGRTNSVEARMDAAEGEINLRATTTYVDNQIASAVIDPSQIPVFDSLEARITTAEVDINSLEGTVALKADTTEVEGIDVRLTDAEVKVDSLEGQITLKVDQTEFDNAETRITSAEQALETIDGAAITQNVVDLRRVTERVDDAEVQTIGELLTFYENRKALKEDIAFVSTEIRARIDDTNVALAEAKTALGAQIDGNGALIVEERTARADADSAMVADISTLRADVEGVSATLTQDYYTSADADQAIAAAREELKSEIEDPNGDSIGAKLATDHYTIADADEAIASAKEELEARMDDADASLTRDYYTKVSTRTAIANTREVLEAQIEDTDNQIRATLESDYYTSADADQAIATAKQELEARMDQGDSAITATLTQEYYTIADADQAIATARNELKSEIEDPNGNSIGATLVNDYYTSSEADDAISVARQELKAEIENPAGSSVGATLVNDYYTSTDTDQAISEATQTLRSEIENPAGTSIGATLVSDYYTSADTDQAITQQINGLQAAIENPNGDSIGALLTQDYHTITQADQAMAAKIEEFEATFLDAQGQVKAAALSDYYTISQADQAMAGKIDEFEATILDAEGQVRATALNSYLTETGVDDAIAAREEVLTASIQRLEDLTNASGYVHTLNALDTVTAGAKATVTLGGPAFGEEAALIIREGAGARKTAGVPNGARFIVPMATAATLTGRRSKIALLVRRATTNPAATFSVSYSANTAGHSGAMGSDPLSSNWEWRSFYYDVPSGNEAGDNYVSIFADDSQSGKGIEVARVVVGLSTELEDLPDINELSGQIEDVLGLHLSSDTALGRWVQDIGVNVDDPNNPNQTLSARTKLNADAVADIEGNLSAVVGFRAQAGGAVSLLNLVAMDNPNGPAQSLAKLSADNILLDGTVGTEKLVVGTGKNLLPNADFSQGLLHWSYRGKSGNTGAYSSFYLRARGLSYAGRTYDTLAIYQSTGHSDGFYQVSNRPENENGSAGYGIPVVPGNWYEVQARIATLRCSGMLFGFWRDEDGTHISTFAESIGTWAGSAYNPGGWRRYWRKSQAPSNAAYLELCVRKLGTSSGSNSYLFMHQPQISETHEGAGQASAWSPGSTTVIDGGKILARSITADQLSANSVTAYEANFESLAALGLVVRNADIVEDIKSGNFLAGSRGWRIRQNGSAEFNDVTIRRQLIADQGYMALPSSIDGGNTGSHQVRFTAYIETNTPASAWVAPEKTYIAAVGRRPGSQYGTIRAQTSNVSSSAQYINWGFDAAVLPMTRWSGAQRLWIRVDFIMQLVDKAENFQLEWKLYEVS